MLKLAPEGAPKIQHNQPFTSNSVARRRPASSTRGCTSTPARGAFPIKTTVYISGAVPSVTDEAADKNTVAAYGDTRTQTESVFKAIEATLTRLDLKMSDVVKMQVFLVGDPANDGKMDFGGFMDGYTQFFGTEAQPNLPARSVVQVAGLANPGFLVEIEVTAVRPSSSTAQALHDGWRASLDFVSRILKLAPLSTAPGPRRIHV